MATKRKATKKSRNVPTGTPEKAPTGISAQFLAKLKTMGESLPMVAPPRTDYGFPELPPGVIPKKAPSGKGLFLAMDAHGNREPAPLALDDAPAAFGALNGWLQGGMLGCGLTFPGYPYLAQLTQISEYRSPCEIISTEQTRAWLKIVSKGKGDKAERIQKINDKLDELNVRDKFRRASLQVEQFGRSQIYIEIEGQEGDVERQKPLTKEAGIKPGSLKNLQVIEPYWTTPASYNAAYPERADFYIPTSWYVMGRKTHASRLLSFVSREVPDILKPSYNFGGISLIQLLELTVNMWLRTRKSVNDLINIFSIIALSTDMNSTLTGGDGGDLIKRMQAFLLGRDNKGMMLINKDTEELNMQNVPLSSLDKLQAQSQEHMAAISHIPLIKLFGLVPTGLNSDGGEGEMAVWFDFVKAGQTNLLGPQFQTVLDYIQMDIDGKIDTDIGFEWQPLDEPTAKEQSEMDKADADRDNVYLQGGVVTPDEVREKLQLNPKSGFTNLKGAAPGPEMPDEEGDGEGEGGEEGPPEADPSEAQAAQHAHEATEADKDRKHEMAVTKLKVAKKA